MKGRTGARAHGRTVALALLMCVGATVRLPAQKPVGPSAHPLIRYGKWVALAGAGLMGTKAYTRHRDANATYNALLDRCFTDPHNCDLAPGGHYADPVSESLYAQSRTLDHQGARLLIGAETLFAASAVGFVWELIHRRDDPATIPLAPLVETTRRSTNVGVTLRF